MLINVSDSSVAVAADAQNSPLGLIPARRLDSPTDIRAARLLHASTYLSRGYITLGDLAVDGTVSEHVDPWPNRSTYFGVHRDGELVATARQITARSVDALPAMQLDGLYTEQTELLRAAPPGAVVEISALAKNAAAGAFDIVSVYSGMWMESLRHRHLAWLMAADLALFKHLRRYITGTSARQVGPRQQYMGSIVVPAVIWCAEMPQEQDRMARETRDRWPLRSLLPQMFPPTAPAAPADLSLIVPTGTQTGNALMPVSDGRRR